MKAAWMYLVVLGLGVALQVEAQPAGPGGPGGKRGHGGRGGGQFLKQALQGIDREKVFTALDTDGNGSVSKEEFNAADFGEVLGGALQEAIRARLAERGGNKGGNGGFASLDKDGDGKLTAEEFPKPEAFERIVKQADKDGDGMLSEDEMKEFRASRGGKRGGKRARHGRGDGGGDL